MPSIPSLSKPEKPVYRSNLTRLLLKLPGVTTGRKFGGEAFFYRKKFFCHFHPYGRCIFLETYVSDQVNDVVKDIAGVIPHPEYSGYGWVRLPIRSHKEISQAEKLVETTYRYLRTKKRLAISKNTFKPESVHAARRKLPHVKFKTKEAKKTVQIMIEVPGTTSYDEAERPDLTMILI